MTTVVSMSRGAGKTTAMLVWMATEPHGVCVVFSHREAVRLADLARDQDLDIEGWRFVSIDDVRRGALLGRHELVAAVDNADLVLQSLIGHPVEVISVTP